MFNWLLCCVGLLMLASMRQLNKTRHQHNSALAVLKFIVEIPGGFGSYVRALRGRR